MKISGGAIARLSLITVLMMPLFVHPSSAHDKPNDGVTCHLRDDAYVTKSGIYAKGTLKIKNTNVSQYDPDDIGGGLDGDREVIATVVVHTGNHKQIGSNNIFNNYFVESKSTTVFKWKAMITGLGAPHHVHLRHCHTL